MRFNLPTTVLMGFPGASDGKESTRKAGGPGSTPGSGGSPGEGHGNPLQYPGLENPMGRGARRAAICGVAESDTTERLNAKGTKVVGCPISQAWG